MALIKTVGNRKCFGISENAVQRYNFSFIHTSLSIILVILHANKYSYFLR